MEADGRASTHWQRRPKGGIHWDSKNKGNYQSASLQHFAASSHHGSDGQQDQRSNTTDFSATPRCESQTSRQNSGSLRRNEAKYWKSRTKHWQNQKQGKFDAPMSQTNRFVRRIQKANESNNADIRQEKVYRNTRADGWSVRASGSLETVKQQPGKQVPGSKEMFSYSEPSKEHEASAFINFRGNQSTNKDNKFSLSKHCRRSNGTSARDRSSTTSPPGLLKSPEPLEGFDNRCLPDSDSDILDEESDEDYMSDSRETSHETQKNSKVFRRFFETFDDLTLKEIEDTKWHCPACQGGVGSIDWYKGLKPLLSHAKTVRSKRVKLHRQFAVMLEEELKRRGAFLLREDEMFGKWSGLQELPTNHDSIVWPPMVVIQSVYLNYSEKNEWLQKGKHELRHMFKDYNINEARHADTPEGDKRMSMLIFEDSATGCFDAVRLHQNFASEGRGRDAWESSKIMFNQRTKVLFFGYLARRQDVDVFNKHSKGKAKLKYEVRTYQSMCVDPWRQMQDSYHKFVWYKNMSADEKHRGKVLKESLSAATRKLQLKEDEIRMIRRKTIEQHEQNKKEIDSLEVYYKEELAQLSKEMIKKEDVLDEMLQNFKSVVIKHCEDLEKGLLKEMECGKKEKQTCMKEKINKQTDIIEGSFNYCAEYEQTRQELIKTHNERRKQLKLQQLEEEVLFEKKVEEERLHILNKYTERRNNYRKKWINAK